MVKPLTSVIHFLGSSGLFVLVVWIIVLCLSFVIITTTLKSWVGGKTSHVGKFHPWEVNLTNPDMLPQGARYTKGILHPLGGKLSRDLRLTVTTVLIFCTYPNATDMLWIVKNTSISVNQYQHIKKHCGMSVNGPTNIYKHTQFLALPSHYMSSKKII